MGIIVPVAGGKGGVGKSIVSLNLAVALAAQCKRTILCDLDLGGANLHTMLGLKNNQAGLGNYIHRQEKNMSDLLQSTGIANLHFIAGDCLFPGVANMDYFMKLKIIKELQKLDCDYLILDLGAGSTHNIIDFFLMTYNGIIVVTPEITSILNAYSFMKSTVYRFCFRQFAPKSPERTILQNSVLQRIEGKDYSFSQILSVIEQQFPDSGKKTKEQMLQFTPRVIMNMGRSQNDVEMGNRLRNLIKNKLSIDIDFIGFIPYDESVQLALVQRQPVSILYPQSPFSSVMQPIALRVVAAGANQNTNLEDAQEDLADIIKNFYAQQGDKTE